LTYVKETRKTKPSATASLWWKTAIQARATQKKRWTQHQNPPGPVVHEFSTTGLGETRKKQTNIKGADAHKSYTATTKCTDKPLRNTGD